MPWYLAEGKQLSRPRSDVDLLSPIICSPDWIKTDHRFTRVLSRRLFIYAWRDLKGSTMLVRNHGRQFILILLGAFFCPISSQNSIIEKRNLVNSCIDGNNHKREPGPEDDLHKQVVKYFKYFQVEKSTCLLRLTCFCIKCSPWKKNSCCTGNTTVHAHGEMMYGFNYDHCPNQQMSKKCRGHFIQDLCFYECSPNVGPWIQSVSLSINWYYL